VSTLNTQQTHQGLTQDLISAIYGESHDQQNTLISYEILNESSEAAQITIVTDTFITRTTINKYGDQAFIELMPDKYGRAYPVDLERDDTGNLRLDTSHLPRLENLITKHFARPITTSDIDHAPICTLGTEAQATLLDGDVCRLLGALDDGTQIVRLVNSNQDDPRKHDETIENLLHDKTSKPVLRSSEQRLLILPGIGEYVYGHLDLDRPASGILIKRFMPHDQTDYPRITHLDTRRHNGESRLSEAYLPIDPAELVVEQRAFRKNIETSTKTPTSITNYGAIIGTKTTPPKTHWMREFEEREDTLPDL
jgi:hypothetical protein